MEVDVRRRAGRHRTLAGRCRRLEPNCVRTRCVAWLGVTRRVRMSRTIVTE